MYSIEGTNPFREIARDLFRVTARRIAISVVSIPHLKPLKQIGGRPQDLADIEALESIDGEEP